MEGTTRTTRRRTGRSPLATVLAVAGCAAPLLPVAGCGVYSTRPGLLPGHIQRIAIPTFENQTTEVGLDQEVTQAVVDRFVSDNNLRVVGEREADALLQGAVVGYRNAIFGFTGREQAEEYRVTVTVAVRLVDKVKNRELWSDERLAKFENYYVVQVPGQAPKDERDGRQEAIRKLADEILSRTVEHW